MPKPKNIEKSSFYSNHTAIKKYLLSVMDKDFAQKNALRYYSTNNKKDAKTLEENMSFMASNYTEDEYDFQNFLSCAYYLTMEYENAGKKRKPDMKNAYEAVHDLHMQLVETKLYHFKDKFNLDTYDNRMIYYIKYLAKEDLARFNAKDVMYAERPTTLDNAFDYKLKENDLEEHIVNKDNLAISISKFEKNLTEYDTKTHINSSEYKKMLKSLRELKKLVGEKKLSDFEGEDREKLTEATEKLSKNVREYINAKGFQRKRSLLGNSRILAAVGVDLFATDLKAMLEPEKNLVKTENSAAKSNINKDKNSVEFIDSEDISQIDIKLTEEDMEIDMKE